MKMMTTTRVCSGSSSEISRAKKELRPLAKSRLGSLTSEEKTRQSARICRALLKEPLYVSARSISVYLNMKDEVGTMDIVKDAFRSNKKVYIPQYFTKPEASMNMVELLGMEDLESLPKTSWHTKQPPSGENTHREIAKEIDLIIVPGLAFSLAGERLGRGMGFYDKYLSGLHQRPATLALAFDVQIFEKLPTEAGRDFLVDKVLVGERDGDGDS
uniref:5-formyltetrahydrofolate cyclo-ligase n=1 Tax=Caligus rogercresseyi TaxID=217165 RepID=C1BRR5_CALRO|nr:5-formyltetrahydrofolate cyclo-ligase [Caligus rogercresseyi]